jgi:hypothetical protein
VNYTKIQESKTTISSAVPSVKRSKLRKVVIPQKTAALVLKKSPSLLIQENPISIKTKRKNNTFLSENNVEI